MSVHFKFRKDTHTGSTTNDNWTPHHTGTFHNYKSWRGLTLRGKVTVGVNYSELLGGIVTHITLSGQSKTKSGWKYYYLL